MMKFILLLLIPLALAFPAFADGAGPIHIADAKARPTAPGATTGVVYMVVMNHGTADDVITGLSTPAADKAEMHRSVNENGVMRMDAVGDLPLKLGDSFPLTLNFAKAGAVTVTVAVQQIKVAPKAMQDMPGMKM